MNNSLNKFDYLITKAVELGVDEAKILDSSTVAVGEWVRWKCQYGCPFYDKGWALPLHNPKVGMLLNVALLAN